MGLFLGGLATDMVTPRCQLSSLLRWIGVQGGVVGEFLGVTVEGVALDQFEIEVAATLKDRQAAGLAGDDREDGHLDEPSKVLLLIAHGTHNRATVSAQLARATAHANFIQVGPYGTLPTLMVSTELSRAKGESSFTLSKHAVRL